MWRRLRLIFLSIIFIDEQTSQQTRWTLDETLHQPVQQHELPRKCRVIVLLLQFFIGIFKSVVHLYTSLIDSCIVWKYKRPQVKFSLLFTSTNVFSCPCKTLFPISLQRDSPDDSMKVGMSDKRGDMGNMGDFNGVMGKNPGSRHQLHKDSTMDRSPYYDKVLDYVYRSAVSSQLRKRGLGIPLLLSVYDI